MKKTAAALLFAFAFSAPAFSQKWAIQAAPVFSRFMDNDYPAPYYSHIGWQSGLMHGATFRNRDLMHLEFNFIQKGDRRTLSTFLTGSEIETQNRISFLEMNVIWRILFSKKRTNSWVFEPGAGAGIGFTNRVRIQESGNSETNYRINGFTGLPILTHLGLSKPLGKKVDWFFRTTISFYADPFLELLLKRRAAFGSSNGHIQNGLFGHMAFATGLRYPISPQKPAK